MHDEEIYNGGLIDDRPKELIQRDFRDEEVRAAGPLNFVEKDVSDLPFYERRDQAQSSTCMNQAYAKLRGILMKQRSGRYLPLSGGYLYRRRDNQDSEGMFLYDIFGLGKEHGLPFELLDPSQNMSEKEITNAKELPYSDEVAGLFTDKDEKFVYLPNNFDAIAGAIQSGLPVLLMIFADRDEYNIVPKVLRQSTPSTSVIRHGICGHDTLKYKGQDCILMDDSWGILNSKAEDDFQKELKDRGQRLLTRDFVNKRVYGAGYIVKLRMPWEDGYVPPVPPAKPKVSIGKDLEWGMENDADVRELQEVLKYENLFPHETPSTGAFYGITLKAVQDFQKKHGIASYGTPETTGFGRVGPKTRALINSLYA